MSDFPSAYPKEQPQTFASNSTAPCPETVEVPAEQVEAAAKAYAEATGYYVEFHRGLSSPSADLIRKGIRAALSARTLVASPAAPDAGVTGSPSPESVALVREITQRASRAMKIGGPYSMEQDAHRIDAHTATLRAQLAEVRRQNEDLGGQVQILTNTAEVRETALAEANRHIAEERKRTLQEVLEAIKPFGEWADAVKAVRTLILSTAEKGSG